MKAKSWTRCPISVAVSWTLGTAVGVTKPHPSETLVVCLPGVPSHTLNAASRVDRTTDLLGVLEGVLYGESSSKKRSTQGPLKVQHAVQGNTKKRGFKAHQVQLVAACTSSFCSSDGRALKQVRENKVKALRKSHAKQLVFDVCGENECLCKFSLHLAQLKSQAAISTIACKPGTCLARIRVQQQLRTTWGSSSFSYKIDQMEDYPTPFDSFDSLSFAETSRSLFTLELVCHSPLGQNHQLQQALEASRTVKASPTRPSKTLAPMTNETKECSCFFFFFSCSPSKHGSDDESTPKRKKHDTAVAKPYTVDT